MASVLAGKSISELDITLNANIAMSGFLFGESKDNVVLTPLQVAVPETFKLGAARAGGAGSKFHTAATALPLSRVTTSIYRHRAILG